MKQTAQIKNLHLGSECERAFIRKFDEICYSRQKWQVWTDFICAVAISIANTVDICGDTHDEREKEFARCIQRLGGIEHVRELFEIIVSALDADQEQDFLGKLFMLLELGNHWRGQFFTPYDVCRMMAEVSLNGGEGNIKTEAVNKCFISILDPACGAGATLIAAANQLRRQGINYQNRAFFVGQDIDRVAGMMCFIQLSLLGCAGYVVIADTLSNPITGHGVLFPCPKPDQEIFYMPMIASELWTQRRLIRAIFQRNGEK